MFRYNTNYSQHYSTLVASITAFSRLNSSADFNANLVFDSSFHLLGLTDNPRDPQSRQDLFIFRMKSFVEAGAYEMNEPISFRSFDSSQFLFNALLRILTRWENIGAVLAFLLAMASFLGRLIPC
jgi:hypothetical protein